MFKFWKKIIVFLIIVSPLLYILFIGYPIKKTSPLPGQSARCFKVGELIEFTKCYREGKRLDGIVFMKDITNKVSSFHPFMGYLVFMLLFIHAFMILLL